LAGANLIYGAGMFESGITFDYGQLLIDNDIAAIIRRYVRGIPVNEETLAVDLIHEIGPKGDYLSCGHTMKHMRETILPPLFDRRVRQEWEADGATDIYTRATEESRRVLAEHVVEPLPESVQAEIRGIVDEVETVLAPA
jgi:trimethylamine---corrinoid protein Co-methyltransferase